jgi:hypothetical protein
MSLFPVLLACADHAEVLMAIGCCIHLVEGDGGQHAAQCGVGKVKPIELWFRFFLIFWGLWQINLCHNVSFLPRRFGAFCKMDEPE